jgi:hypothetical protein
LLKKKLKKENEKKEASGAGRAAGSLGATARRIGFAGMTLRITSL